MPKQGEDLLVSIGPVRHIWHYFGFLFWWIRTIWTHLSSGLLKYTPLISKASKISFIGSIIHFQQRLHILIEILFQQCALLESNEIFIYHLLKYSVKINVFQNCIYRSNKLFFLLRYFLKHRYHWKCWLSQRNC